MPTSTSQRQDNQSAPEVEHAPIVFHRTSHRQPTAEVGGDVTQARVLTFHVDSDGMAGLSEALDGVAEMYSRNSDFRGLVCLNHDGPRHEVMVMTLWDGDGLESTQSDSEQGRRRIAAMSDLGVSSRCYDVLRLIPGPASLESVLAETLAS